MSKVNLKTFLMKIQKKMRTFFQLPILIHWHFQVHLKFIATNVTQHFHLLQVSRSTPVTFSPSKAAKKLKSEKDFPCDQCEKVFSRNQHLQAHIAAIHEENSRFECKECKKRFTISHNLKRHMESVHEKLRKYQCDMCEKTYSESRDLKSHKAVVHGIGEPISCHLCPKIFTKTCHLKSHISGKF